MPTTTRTRTGLPKSLRKLFTAAVLGGAGWVAHLCTNVAPHAYRQVPNMVAALLLAAAVLTAFAAVPGRES